MADRSIVVRLSANASQYIAAMEAAKRSTMGLSQDAEKALSRIGSGMQSAGRTMTMAVTAPMVAGGVAATRMAQDWQNSFSRMVGLAEVPASEVGRLQTALKGLTAATGTAPSDLARGLYQAASSGLDATQALESTTLAAKAAALGMGSARDATGLIAAATNAWGKENISATQIMDQLTMALREGKAEPDELAHALGRVVPIAAAMGLEFSEVAGTTAYLSNIMGDTDITVTSLRDALVKLNNPTVQGRQVLEDMGTSFEELKATIGQDGILGAFDLLREHGFDKNTEAVQKLFADVQGQQAAFALLDDASGALATTLGKTANAQGAFNEAFSVWDATDAAQMSKAWGEMQVAILEVGEVLLPFVADVMGGVANMVTAFENMPGPVRAAAGAFAVLAATSGPLLFLVGSVVKHMATIRGAMLATQVQAEMTAAAVSRIGPPQTGFLMTAAVIASAYQNAQEPGRPQDVFGVGKYGVAGSVSPTLASHGELYPNLPSWGRPSASPFNEADWAEGSVQWGAPEWMARSLQTSGSGAATMDRFMNRNASVAGQNSAFVAEMNALVAAGEASAAAVLRSKAAVEAYQQVTARSDWGGMRAFETATNAMSAYTAMMFGAKNQAIAYEAAVDGLDEAISKNGFTFAENTAEGRENHLALQAVAQTLDEDFGVAFANAGGNMETFKASATEIGEKTLDRLAKELNLNADEVAVLRDEMNLTAGDYEIRAKLMGDAEAFAKIDMLSGVIGNLSEEAQKEIVMHLNNDDPIAALEVVNRELGATVRPHFINIYANDHATSEVQRIQRVVDSLTGKTITIRTNREEVTYQYTRAGSLAPRATAMGGYFDSADYRLIGEAGAEVVLPLTRPSRMRELLADPRVMQPLAAAMFNGSTTSNTSSTPLIQIGSVQTRDPSWMRRELEAMAWRSSAVPRNAA